MSNLKVNIVPVVDTNALNDTVDKINKRVKGAAPKVGVQHTAPDVPKVAAPKAPGVAPPSAPKATPPAASADSKGPGKSSSLKGMAVGGAVAGAAAAGVMAIFDILQKIFSMLVQSSGALQGVMKVIGNNIKLFMRPIGDMLASWLRPIGNIMKVANRAGRDAAKSSGAKRGSVEYTSAYMGGFFGSMFSQIGEAISSWLSGLDIVKTLTNFAGWLTSLPGKASEFLGNIWSSITAGLSNIWSKIVEIASRIWNTICTYATEIWNAIKEVASKVWNAIKDTAVKIWNGIKETASKIWNSIRDAAVNVWNGIKETASNVWNTISGVASGVWNSISNVATNVWNSISGVASRVWNTISGVATSIWGGIKSVVDSVKKVFESVYNAAMRVVDVFKKIFGAVGDFAGGVKKSISNAVDSVAGFFGFAEGGYIPSTPGGMPIIVSEGGEGEFIVPESKLPSFIMGHLPDVLGTINGSNVRAIASAAGVSTSNSQTTYNLGGINISSNGGINSKLDIERIFRELIKEVNKKGRR